MFRQATLKLTALYLGIIIAICVFFSINLYRLSMRELNSGASRQATFLRNAPPLRGLVNWDDMENARQSQLEEGRQRIIAGLINANAIIILVGGVGSYLLARRTVKPIQQAHDAQSAFAADASHELRTPLATMRAEIEVALREKNLTLNDARELLKSNLEELSKLTTLSEGLLRLARTDLADGLTMEITPLKPLISEAIERSALLAKEKRIKISTSVPEEVSVRGDGVSLVELFATLIDNAVKYSPEQKPINISAQTQGKYCEIRIEDRGLGIKAAEIPYIFDRFYRGESSRSAGQTSGYGLGLAIARNIARLHKGDIWVRIGVEGGTVFVVGLLKS